MEFRRFEITIASADNLPDVRRLGVGQIKSYAIVSIDRKSSATRVDTQGDRNPRWNQTFEYTIDESCVQKPGSYIVVKLCCKRKWGRRDRLIGDEVRIEVNRLCERGERNEINSESYVLPNSEGGILRISFRFREVLVPRQSAWKKYLCCGLMNLVSMEASLIAL